GPVSVPGGLRRWAVHARLADELCDGLAGLGALRAPLLELLGLEFDLRLRRVVGAHLVDVAPVARRLRVGDDDAVERVLLGSVAGESDLDHERPLVRASFGRRLTE